MKKKIILSIVILLVLVVGSLLFFKLTDKEEGPKNTSSVVENIENYNYSLDDRDTKLFRDNYMELKKVLGEDEIDYEEYSKLLAKLFSVDLYTLNNKINKYDVGSLEYIHPNIVDNFKLKVQDTLYRYLEDNSDNKRSQDLPEVKSIEIISYNEEAYTLEDTEYDSYVIAIKWDYVKNLGYDIEGTIRFIKVDDKLQMVEFGNEIEEVEE